MKTYNAVLKIFLVVFSLVLISASFSACSSVEKTKDKAEMQESMKPDSDETTSDKTASDEKNQIPDNPITNPRKKDNTLTPDTDSIKLAPASESAVSCSSEEECIELLEKFANPTGNEYDALSVLGSFRYPEKSNDEMMATLKTASDTWHKAITEKIGEKCVVQMTLDKTTSIDLSDPSVTEWNSVNGKTAEAYSNVKCYLTTNYVDNEVKISFDLVKLDGSWYLASTGTLRKIQNVITDELYR